MSLLERRLDTATAVTLATLSLATSVLLNAGVVCSNDGSQYALIRALADDGAAVIDAYVEYTSRVDYAQVGEHYYSDRPPGVAFLVLPLYLLGSALGLDDLGRQEMVSLAAHGAGAAAVVLLFWLARRAGASRAGAVFAALVLAWCTPLRSYSTALFSHAFSAALILGLAHCAWPAATKVEEGSRWRRVLQVLGGIMGGYAAGLDYTNGLPAAAICLASACVGAVPEAGPSAERVTLALRFATLDRAAVARTLAVYLAAGIAGATPTLVYHTVVFGAPCAIPYHYDVNFAYAHTVGGMYGGSFFGGFVSLLVDPLGGGLFIWSPVLLFSVWFFPALRRSCPRGFWLFLLPALALFLVTCRNLTPEGGASRDVRYLSSVLPFVVLPSAWAFDWVLGRSHSNTEAIQAPRAGWAGVLAGLFFLSALLQAVKHNALWVRNGEQWIAAFADTLKTDAGPTALAFVQWAFPHPVAALVVLLVGVALGFLLRRLALRL